MEKIIIAAVSNNGIIGDNGTIPWHSKEDLEHFKELTTGHPVIMGRKTYQSIGKLLPNRTNLIISEMMYAPPKAVVVNNLDEAFEYCEKELHADKVFVIGGGMVYRDAIDKVDTLIISHMNVSVFGDTYFPEISKKEWESVELTSHDGFNIVTYKRILK